MKRRFVILLQHASFYNIILKQTSNVSKQWFLSLTVYIEKYNIDCLRVLISNDFRISYFDNDNASAFFLIYRYLTDIKIRLTVGTIHNV